jgi:hypothetical protein
MFRPQTSTLTLPFSLTWPSDVIPPLQAPFHFLPDVERFARFMLATPEYLQCHFNDELRDLALEGKLREDLKDPIGAGFVEEARGRILKQIDLSFSLSTPNLQVDIGDVQRSLSRALVKSSIKLPTWPTGISPANRDQASSSKIATFSEKSPLLTNRPSRLVESPLNTGSYFFYMAANGRYVFLHPLDIRILLAKYTKYSQFPPNINLLVEAFVESSVDSELRKRCKYLAHLPEGSDVVFVEANLEAEVGKEILQPFEIALKQRRERRLEKERKEECARIKAEELTRQREREVGLWRDIDRIDFRSQIRGFADQNDDSSSLPPVIETSMPVIEGAWGSRSFAKAANSEAAGRTGSKGSELGRTDDDVRNFEVAWQELEEGATQRKGRHKQMIILGAGRRRR